MTFITDISREKAQLLLDGTPSDVEHFRLDYMQKVIDSCPDDVICGLFPEFSKNPYVMLSVVRGHGPGTYVHELTGFRRGYGERALYDVFLRFGPMWLMCGLEPTGDMSGGPKFRPNTKLRDRFYRRIPWLREYACCDTRWFCDVSFFYSEGFDEKELYGFINQAYKRKGIR